jgi:protein phosphatase
MTFKIKSTCLSDIGLVRQNNEDVCAELPDCRFYVIADGMGGHQAGEVASKTAVDAFLKIVKKGKESRLYEGPLADTFNFLKAAIEEVNRIVYEKGKTALELKGMGTTLCFLFFHDQGLIYGHVGDSRIYRLRNHKLEQLTKDHSLIRELVEHGQLSERQVGDYYIYKNIITKAVGTEPKVEPTIKIAEVQPHDLFFMCTDGLSDLLTAQEIESVLNFHSSLPHAAETLIQAAKDRGAHDNVSVLIAKASGEHERKNLSR